MPIDKRKVQEINAGSMADIAFLLLIFFLVATTMNVDTGIARNLPPMPPEDQKVEDMKVKIRNLLPVLVNGRGDIFVGRAGEQEYVDIHQLKDRAKDFLLNVMDDPQPARKRGRGVRAPRRQQMELSGRKRRTLAANDQRYPISDLHHGTERADACDQRNP